MVRMVRHLRGPIAKGRAEAVYGQVAVSHALEDSPKRHVGKRGTILLVDEHQPAASCISIWERSNSSPGSESGTRVRAAGLYPRSGGRQNGKLEGPGTAAVATI
jgi:hypothetical protein